MNISIHAIGRLKKGPEFDLNARYCERFGQSCGQLGLSFGGIQERAESRADSAPLRKQDEAQSLQAYCDNRPTPRVMVVLDERGKTMTSPDFALWIGQKRDHGAKSMVFALGGPDGHSAETAQNADLLLSFGKATWPHQMARLMLAEQLYRAAMILSGHPYHRI